MAHPEVMVIAFLLFVGLEIAALPRFVRAARIVGKVPLAMIGMAVALVILIFSAVMGYYVAAEYGLSEVSASSTCLSFARSGDSLRWLRKRRAWALLER